MTIQNYCMISEQTNICENVCVWDGNPNTWTPPPGYLMVVQANTPAKIWSWDPELKVWGLVVVMGAGGVGFTWDDTYLITNQPEPTEPPKE